jgi:hypothetical protein
MTTLTEIIDEPLLETKLSRRVAMGNSHEILADVYEEDTNLIVWQRSLADELILAAKNIFELKPNLQVAVSVTPDDVVSIIEDNLQGIQHAQYLVEDTAELVDMFCCLFEQKRAGLRLTVLDRAMCPRFHVDRVPCRLVTTYHGEATQWLKHQQVDRSKLGPGNLGKPDEESGLFQSVTNIQQLKSGDVALLKGELWQGNEGAGLVHRSPALKQNSHRLLLTLDFIG